MSKIIWTDKVALKNIYVHITRISEKRGYEFEGEWEGYMGGFRGRKGKGQLCIYNIKNKRKTQKTTKLWDLNKEYNNVLRRGRRNTLKTQWTKVSEISD